MGFFIFTGIISHTGTIKLITDKSISVRADLAKNLNVGDSISVNGVCLTITKNTNQDFFIDYVEETSKKTNIRNLEINDLVNLELPATPNSLLSGHIVQGHVDTTGRLVENKQKANSRELVFEFDSKFAKYLVDKGSVAINGIALSVNQPTENSFWVAIIPHTWNNTVLKNIKIGDEINLEFDVIAKYIERLLVK